MDGTKKNLPYIDLTGPDSSSGQLNTDDDPDYQVLLTPEQAREVTGQSYARKIVAWKKQIRSKPVIVMYGPRSAAKFELSTAAQEHIDFDEKETPQFGLDHRLGNEKVDRKLIRRKQEFKAIQGLAYSCVLEDLKPKEKGEKGEPPPLEIWVRWEISGKIAVVWETQSSISHLWNSPKACDEHIYHAATYFAARHQEWLDGQRQGTYMPRTLAPGLGGLGHCATNPSPNGAMLKFREQWCTLEGIDSQKMDAVANADFLLIWNITKESLRTYSSRRSKAAVPASGGLPSKHNHQSLNAASSNPMSLKPITDMVSQNTPKPQPLTPSLGTIKSTRNHGAHILAQAIPSKELSQRLNNSSLWEARDQDLQRHTNQIIHQCQWKEATPILEAKLHNSVLEKNALQEEYEAFIRQQQEASFKQMKSSRWIPMDGREVKGHLDRLKMNIRSWAKSSAIKDISLLQSLTEAEFAVLMKDLGNVAMLENGQLLVGLSTAAKSPMLLLSALLAHSVYTHFFRGPFFFVGNNGANKLTTYKPEEVLEGIYERAQQANQQDAHIWRSQTIRLLMPPLRNDTLETERNLRRTTEASISQAAERQFSSFLNGPASHLLKKNTNEDSINKLRKIYSDAAKLAYQLWTRRAFMKLFTLHELENLSFDAESLDFDPDNLVRYDDHKDHLKGRMVTVMVHPLLKIYGNEEAEDYGQEGVWVKGVVWLDSRNG